MAAKTVLVTGGAGYVGSHLTRKLLDRGHRVRVLDRCLYGDSGLQEIRNNPQLEFHCGNICNPDDLNTAAQGCGTVVALAARVGDAACDLDPEQTLEVNYRSTHLMLDACHRHGVERLVFASSCSVYGANGHALLTEDSHMNPVSLYAKTRIMSEEAIDDGRGDLDVVVLRLATVCGLSPRMRFDLMVNAITAHAAVERRIRIMGADQWRPHIHVQDAAEAFLCAVEIDRRMGMGVFNVGSNELNFTIREVAAKVLEALPETAVDFVETHDDPRSYRVSFDRIHREMGFVPEFRVEDAIDEIRRTLRAGFVDDYQAPIYHNAKWLSGNGHSASV